jgi:hypothetical protein
MITELPNYAAHEEKWLDQLQPLCTDLETRLTGKRSLTSPSSPPEASQEQLVEPAHQHEVVFVRGLPGAIDARAPQPEQHTPPWIGRSETPLRDTLSARQSAP